MKQRKCKLERAHASAVDGARVSRSMFAVGGFLTWCAPGSPGAPLLPISLKQIPPDYVSTIASISDGRALRLALYGAPVAVSRITRAAGMFSRMLEPWPDFVTAPTLIRIAAALLFRSAHGELMTYGPYEGDYSAGSTLTLGTIDPFHADAQSPWPRSGYAYFRDFNGLYNETAFGDFSLLLSEMIRNGCGCRRCAHPVGDTKKKG